ncbi:hypothetical protein [Christiangramia crocea]|uniref:Uncharacterized protein n=1 Tax=Christiangramia crocea TaxID=2904124 RepID=A0A9X2A7P7_9FLAO|nr:hypothetical protein [Gramella crocea]MCG9971028.1 hypothetical protein [Gramella crocea]
MTKIISASIDVTKIDKNKIAKTNKEGKPFKNNAQYLNVDIIVNDETNDYGQDTSIKISQTKEEREAGEKATYIGNGKTVWEKNESSEPSYEAEPYNEEEDDLPF